MTKKDRILSLLPATSCEIASHMRSKVHSVNAFLQWLRKTGLIQRTDRRGLKYARRGRAPFIWERVGSRDAP